MNMPEVDDDALSVMKQAGQQFAETQRYRHYANEWKLPKDQQDERVKHWHAVEVRIGELVREIKDRLKEERGQHG